MAKPINSYSPACGRRRDLPPRWHIVRTYRSATGPVELEDDIEELRELHHVVEHGPDWDTLVDIRVMLNRPTHPGLTLEQAEKL